MKNRECEIVRDLIPLVIDSVAGEESRKLVEQHTAGCAECRRLMDDMRAQIAPAPLPEADEAFVRFCLKIRRVLSWKKVLRAAAVLVLTCVVLGGGLVCMHYKMYVDTEDVKPETYHISVDSHGLLAFDFTVPGLRGDARLSVFTLPEQGIVYLAPSVPAWTNFFEPENPQGAFSEMSDIRFIDGQLFHVEVNNEASPVFNEITGGYEYGYTADRRKITELRIGTENDYYVAYREGDTIPVADDKPKATP